MIIKNGYVFTEKGIFEKTDVAVSAAKRITVIGELSDDASQIVDAEGMYVIPGLVDVHTHGAMGFDYCDATTESLQAILQYERAHGITACCPTTMTYPEERLVRILQNFSTDSANGAGIAGVNLEGPFISRKKAGAQNTEYVTACDIQMFRRLQAASGNRIRLVTIAPEEEHAIDFIESVREDVHVSLGHTDADYTTGRQAFAAGADHITHMFNAMPGIHHRDPGIIGAAWEDKKVYVELIADLIHIHPSTIRMAFAMFGEDRIVLISDSMRATGMPDGEYELGGQKVIKRENEARLTDGTLAGSVSNLFTCMRNAVSVGIPLEAAVKAATVNPAKSIGMESEVGVIRPGAAGDLLLLDRELNLVRVL